MKKQLCLRPRVVKDEGGLMRLNLRQLVVPESAVPADAVKLDERDALSGGMVFSRIPGQYRRTTIELALEEPVQLAPDGAAIVKVDYRVAG